MPDELRDKTAKYLFSWFADIPRKEWEQLGELERYPWVLHSNNIFSLIDSQRCVWTFTDDYTIKTECGEELKPYCKDDLYKRKKPSHCWNCGKRIEVKDGQG